MGEVKLLKTNNKINIRFAEEKDIELIVSFIRKLAEHVNLLHEVIATEEVINKAIFKERIIKVILAEYNNEPVGFALFYYNFSTFLGKKGIYIEDLFVRKEVRGKGIGKKLLSYLAQIALKENCGRLEWSVLNWNEPSINFYKSLGAVPMNEWTVYRLYDDKIKNLAMERISN
jgi:GNAT superfamily N-acetyltransferase